MRKFYILLTGLLFVANTHSQTAKTFEVYFDLNKAELDISQYDSLVHFLHQCKQNKFLFTKMDAFSDSIGTEEYNLYLSERRLASVVEILKKHSVEIPVTKAYGENHEITSNKTPTSYNSWRKVEIHYTINAETIPESKNTISQAKFRENVLSGEGIVLDVQFYGGTANLFPNAMTDIEALATFMKANPNLKVLVRGHVCCMDDMTLSVQRANVVYNELLKFGIEPTRLDFKGYSNYLPVITPEVTEEDRQRNRRVDVVFSKI